MNWNKPPLPVMAIACLYILVGVIAFAHHFPQLLASERGAIWIELTELLATVCGASMLRGYNWARWLAVAWIAPHVVLSAFQSFQEFVIHAFLCAAITWLLFRPEANHYFRRA